MSDLGAIVRWLLALEIIGWGLYPLLYLALPGLRDRGLTLVKPFALLLLVFPVWFLASSGLPIFAPPALTSPMSPPPTSSPSCAARGVMSC